MGYIPRKTVYRFAREQLHLNKAKLLKVKVSLSRPIGVVFGLSTICFIMSFLLTASDRTKYSLQRVNSAMGPSKSIRYSGDFVIAGCVSIYFTAILPGFEMLFVITGSSL